MKRIVLIVSGSVAAYKAPEIIRRGQDAGMQFVPVLTAGGAQFITPLLLSSIAAHPCYTDLFSLKDESEMGHIRLSREADALLVAPASADMLVKMASGRADDLACAVLLASDKPVYVAPAMNPHMWNHSATQANIATLLARGVQVLMPGTGQMACHETGAGRMAEPSDIVAALQAAPAMLHRPLAGKKALVTAGPTHEVIDPVRFIGNHSSGKQGYEVAAALAAEGAEVMLVSGPTALACPVGVRRIDVQSAQDMFAACEAALPVDIAVCAAAVADWRVASPAGQKIKKSGTVPTLTLTENPDILRTLCTHAHRPACVVGFAAETEHLAQHAKAKLLAKGCDLMVANDVSGDVFGSDENEALLIGRGLETHLPRSSKAAVAQQLVTHIIEQFSHKEKCHA